MPSQKQLDKGQIQDQARQGTVAASAQLQLFVFFETWRQAAAAIGRGKRWGFYSLPLVRHPCFPRPIMGLLRNLAACRNSLQGGSRPVLSAGDDVRPHQAIDRRS